VIAPKCTRDQFVLNCFRINSILKFFENLGEQLFKFTGDFENKLKTPHQKFPLDKIAKIEKSRVPSAIAVLCEQINLCISKPSFKIEKELRIMKKDEINLCNSIVSAINAQYVEEINFMEISFIILLNSLKKILKSLPEILFTNLVSDILLYSDDNSLFTKVLLKRALDKIPQENYETIKCISKMVHNILISSSSNSVKLICSFFEFNFFQTNDPRLSIKAKNFLELLFKNFEELFL
jgi:hypothetical protein